MLDKERAAQAKGIPQVIETPEKFMDLAKFIREKILGKPVPDHYDDYETYTEALVTWKLDQPSPKQTPEAKPLIDDYETYEDFTEALIGWLISQPHNLAQRTNNTFNKALTSQDPDDWKALRQILGDCLQPVAFYVPDLDGTGIIRTWLFERTHDGIVGHRKDGTATLFWSQESGILSWGRDQVPAMV